MSIVSKIKERIMAKKRYAKEPANAEDEPVAEPAAEGEGE